MYILVVEDCPINRFFLEKALRNIGHEVSSVSNGHEAVELLESAPVDMVLMDVKMPVMNGLEATRFIRSREDDRFRNIPVIAVTACACDDDRQRCLEAGMDDVLVKPVIIDNLRRTIDRHAREITPL